MFQAGICYTQIKLFTPSPLVAAPLKKQKLIFLLA